MNSQVNYENLLKSITNLEFMVSLATMDFDDYGSFSPNLYMVRTTNCSRILSTDIKIKFTTKDKTNEYLESLGYYELCDRYYKNPNHNDILIKVTGLDSKSKYTTLNIIYNEHFQVDELKKLVHEHIFIVDKDSKEDPTFKFIYLDKLGPSMIELDLTHVSILDNSYNMNCSLDKIKEDLNGPKNGITLFRGSPGTGKSYLIKYLSSVIKKDFIFLSNENVGILTNPNFIGFCLTNMQNSIVVIEDAEKLLKDRKIGNNYDISNILSLTDGILGDALNIQVLCTINFDDNIDEAILRKGRLLNSVKFDLLTPDMANSVAKQLNINKEFKDAICLTDVYNYNVENGSESHQRAKMGFKNN